MKFYPFKKRGGQKKFKPAVGVGGEDGVGVRVGGG